MAGCPKPLPAKLGDQIGDLLLDFYGLFQVYRISYFSTPPLKAVAGHLSKAAVQALVLFTKDDKTFVLHFFGGGPGESIPPITKDAQWVDALMQGLCQRQEKGEDPLGVAEWVREVLKAEVEQQRRRRPYRNQGLFSEHYLEYRLPEEEEWKEDPEPIRQRLLALYTSKKGFLEKANEAQTEDEFIRPVLEALGFAYWVQDAVKAAGGVQRPDYVLYPDEETKVRALAHEEETKRYAPALAILEAKYFGCDLDVKRRDARDRVHSPVSPSFQLSQYLLATGREWGILTNGREWRLYWGRAVDKQKRYYAVDLVEALQDPEAFRFFWLFFRREAFTETARGSFLRRVLEGSEQYGLRVGEKLREVVFERVFPLLAEGFLRYHQEALQKPVEEATLQETYRATLILLYRLLFLLYAEDRDLLPVSDTLGYQQYSLTRLRREVAQQMDQGQTFSDRSYSLWERLSTLFTFIDQGEPSLKVPPYNGGLFKRERYPFLESHRVADAFLAPALDRLSRQEDEGGTLRFVDYKYLTVRELGTVYEGLLEFQLQVAGEDLVVVKEKDGEIYKPKAELASGEKPLREVPKGKPYLVRNNRERRLSGSYYTPDYVVEYIVKRVLEPLVEGRREVLAGILKEYEYWREKDPSHLPQLRRKALDVLLDIKVVDPAMGSGHFLVGAVDFLSERLSGLITELGAEPVIEALEELRVEIADRVKAYGLQPRGEQLSDINLLKRMVMKRCVFGVDLNEMAVELAKLSLWLDAFTVGAPLSFLDHHLRHGNSVLGVFKKEFLDWVGKENPLWRSYTEHRVEEATHKVLELLDVRDLTPAEVAQSQRLYAEAEEALLPLRQALDVYAAGFFAPKPKRRQPLHPFLEARFALPNLLDPNALEHRPEILEAMAFARERRFFHWELEFPEVFFAQERKDNPGFDAVIGNPPYVRQEQLGPNKRFFEKVYEAVYAGTADLYTYFFARGLSVLRKGGRLGFISSRQFTRAAYGEGLRRLLTSHTLLEVVDFGENPVFEGVGTFPAIFIVEKGQPIYPIRFKAVSTAEFDEFMKAPAEARGEVLARLVDSAQELGEDAFRPEGWTLANADKNAILRKMEENGVPLGEYAGKFYRGILTGFNEAFFIDESTRNRLIEEDPRSAELIKPLLVGEDVRHYHVRWPNDPRTQYLIVVPSSSDFDNLGQEFIAGIARHPWASAKTEEEARKIFAETYPAVHAYLSKFEPKLRARQDRGRWWWELRACAYCHLLEAPKIVYPDIAKEPRFYLDEKGGFYLTNTLYFIPKSDYYLLAVLNSRVIFGALKLKLSVLGSADEGGGLRLFATHFQHLPIPSISHSTEEPKLSEVLDIAVRLYEEGRRSEVLAWAEAELAAGRRDTVAHFLAYLARKMQQMHAERLSSEEGWREWVKQAFKGADKLGKEWLAEGWVQDGLENGVEAIVERFKARGIKTTPQTLDQLKRHTQENLHELRPLYKRLEDTDRLIDRLVARLYGLSEEEVAMLWATPSA